MEPGVKENGIFSEYILVTLLDFTNIISKSSSRIGSLPGITISENISSMGGREFTKGICVGGKIWA
jgi:hypothetical protein